MDNSVLQIIDGHFSALLIFIGVIIFLLLFRTPIGKKISELRSAKFNGLKRLLLKFGESAATPDALPSPSQPALSGVERIVVESNYPSTPTSALGRDTYDLLGTLWRHQKRHFPKLNKKWAFRVSLMSQFSPNFFRGMKQAQERGFVGVGSKNSLVGLTDAGITFCQSHEEFLEQTNDLWDLAQEEQRQREQPPRDSHQ